ncbi:TPA: type III secretion system protein, partial [Escherichia coli]
PATLQQLKMQASTVQSGVKTDFNSQTLEVDYVFQRWSGDHSVKVFLPTQVLREGTVTLLPSDSHAAYVLSHNIGLLHGLTPELLQPQQEHDQQQRQQYQPQDEEQE